MKKLLGIILLVFLLSANANAGIDGQDDLSKNKNGEVKDCFESINRGIFAFNRGLDQIVIEPIAKGYRYLPSPIRTGTSNVLSNLSNVVTIPNNILQGDFKAAGNNTLRFVINTTLGIVGIFDVAAIIGFEKLDKEDYGQTLASWGMGPGCYIVLPVLGPSTARDTVGSLTNYLGGDAWYNITVRNDTHYVTDFDYYMSKGLEGVDFRAKNIESFNNLEENSMDFYASIKSLYLQNRQQKILNSKKITETQDDSDWEEIETD
jgi:phospholipid-binding lipoprotein MlaA